MIKRKENLSVGRAVVAGGLSYEGCGLQAAWLQDGNSIYFNPGMKRGISIEDRVNAYLAGEDESIPDQWKEVLPDPFETRQQVEIRKNIDGMPMLHGFADYVTGDTVFDLKTGNLEKWRRKYDIQLGIYKWALGVPNAVILHAKDMDDDLTAIPVSKDISLEDIKKAWTNIEGRRAVKGELCKTCPIKKECPLWGEKSLLATDLIKVEKEIEFLQGRADGIRKKMMGLEDNHYEGDAGGYVSISRSHGYVLGSLNIPSRYPSTAHPDLYELKPITEKVKKKLEEDKVPKTEKVNLRVYKDKENEVSDK